MNANSQTTYISGPESTVLVKKCLKSTARKIGFHPQDIEKLLIVVVELTTNIIKFASKGLITISSIEVKGKREIQIKAIDLSSGIANRERAPADGLSSDDSLGFGLGTIKRAAHYAAKKTIRYLDRHIELAIDGLKSIWGFNDFPWLKSLSVEEITNRPLELLTCNNDDATILIGRLDRHHER